MRERTLSHDEVESHDVATRKVGRLLNYQPSAPGFPVAPGERGMVCVRCGDETDGVLVENFR
jgi:hypothetical protein